MDVRTGFSAENLEVAGLGLALATGKLSCPRDPIAAAGEARVGGAAVESDS